MDPLSDVLSLLKPHSQLFAAFDTAGAWSFSFPPYDGIKIAAVLQGGCWGIVSGMNRPVRLEEGDCFLLNSGYEIVLSSDLSLPPQDSSLIMDGIARDGIAVHNGGGEVLLIGGFFTFSSEHAALLLDALPPFANPPRSSNQADVLRWSLDQLRSELRDPMPGGVLVSNHLLHLMLVQVLRLHMSASSAESPAGWLTGLSDRRIRAAISAMHAEPTRHWSLEELARIAGLSRTIFAQRFKRLVGETTMSYLMRWRMMMATDRLRHSEQSITSIAFALGYESESAFCTAFKRAMSCSPTQYRRRSSVSAEDTQSVRPISKTERLRNTRSPTKN
ncbi:AraC family transcriptional regulator [Paraburkholderia silviterrae]|uniref:AraC family transcriptional regulator n=1 Tax=Paraburkholderia silviterrae TaxID=2528715 RepID=A0A4R5M5K8_9BURK|nr:AraC family transcriptional regulator [Paraburkholderia silviterrae]TDG21242.1 AraC family transcriptional regulator [Paraburkholderia silviterrae]